MTVPITIPNKNDKLEIQVYDHNTLLDELVCSLELSIKKIMENNLDTVDVENP